MGRGNWVELNDFEAAKIGRRKREFQNMDWDIWYALDYTLDIF